MITSPRVYSPLCGGLVTVVARVSTSRYGDESVWLCVCGCGKNHLTVKNGKIQSVVLKEPKPKFRVIAGA